MRSWARRSCSSTWPTPRGRRCRPRSQDHEEGGSQLREAAVAGPPVGGYRASMDAPHAVAAPTLVFLPGLGLDSRDWRNTLQDLSGWSAEISPLPGYGRRPDPADDLTPARLARLLVARDLATRTPVVLVGHSSSCQVAAHAACAAPDVVRGLVLVGPTTDPRAGTWPALARRWLATARHERPGQVPTLARQYARTGLRHILRTMDLARRDDIRVPLREVGCPVLVLRGRRDRICPEEWSRALASLPDSGTATTLAAGAHMAPITHAGLVASAVQDFVAGLGDG